MGKVRNIFRQTGIGHAFDLEHFQVINARIPQIIAIPMHTALATLLKSKKPLPVPVIAQAIAKMVMRTKAILITFRMTPFFMQSHSFIKFKFSVPYKINLLGFTKSPNNDLVNHLLLQLLPFPCKQTEKCV